MGRYCGEDYDRSEPVRFLCSREIRCPEGHLVGMCNREIGGGVGQWHYGLECRVAHPQHAYQEGCELKKRAEAALVDAIDAAAKLLRSQGYSVRKLTRMKKVAS